VGLLLSLSTSFQTLMPVLNTRWCPRGRTLRVSARWNPRPPSAFHINSPLRSAFCYAAPLPPCLLPPTSLPRSLHSRHPYLNYKPPLLPLVHSKGRPSVSRAQFHDHWRPCLCAWRLTREPRSPGTRPLCTLGLFSSRSIPTPSPSEARRRRASVVV
jgi:hypothetical protein